jgi:hypothetical protein
VRYSNPVPGFIGLLALNGFLLAAAPADAATKTFTIRPQQTVRATHVDNPANAIDDNQATFAAISLQRVCRADHDQPSRGTVMLDQFPAGYRPLRLEVHWTAWSAFAVMQDNRASVSATLEYSTGQKWQRLESATWTTSSKNCPLMSDGSLPCLGHSVGADLPAGLDSARLRVRVSLAAGFSECEPAGMSGVANLVAHSQIYDVRVVAQKAPAKPAAKKPTKKPSRPRTP